jgi:hypothetical protein
MPEPTRVSLDDIINGAAPAGRVSVTGWLYRPPERSLTEPLLVRAKNDETVVAVYGTLQQLRPWVKFLDTGVKANIVGNLSYEDRQTEVSVPTGRYITAYLNVD